MIRQPEVASGAQRSRKIDGGTVLALVAMGISVMVLANDFSAVNVALPNIEQELESDISTVQWVVNAYALVFAMMIVTGGRLADLFGRRRIFFIGTSIFAGMVVVGLGLGIFFSSVTTAAVTSMEPSRTSLAGGIIYMFQVAGGSVGLGITTAVFALPSQGNLGTDLASLGTRLTAVQQGVLRAILAGSVSSREALAGFDPEIADRLATIVRESLVAGLRWGFGTVALLALVGFAIAVLFIGGRPRQEQPAASH